VEVAREKPLIFDPVLLDSVNESLRRGATEIRLRPKAYAVLAHLMGHSGRLVTKEELLESVWPETFVSDAVLKVAIRQLRDALGDDPRSPRFIETAHRRGYRFIGQLEEGGEIVSYHPAPGSASGASALASRSDDFNARRVVVGRDEAMSLMRTWRGRMLKGERQIVFVTGEAGIGKTALVDTFAKNLAPDRNIRIGRGQCLEQYGTSEAYLPVLEAIRRLCLYDDRIVDVLRAHAPMWLLQMPSLLSASDREVLGREILGATRERMLREIGEALEVLTADQSLVLILEDLHWSDYSTLDLISYLAAQRQPAHLMVIGTYRVVELIVSGHPLKAVKQELLARQQCSELPLEYLSEAAVGEYLAIRFPGNRFPSGLAALIRERTEGNPLFMINVVDYLIAAGLIVERAPGWELMVEIENVEVGVPDSIRQMIEKQVDHIDTEARRTLEAASVAGAEFSALALAAALDEDRAAVETRLDELARRRQFIKDCGLQELPNGEVVSRYCFIHALYQSVLYERVSPSRRVQFHRRIGERGEEVYAGRLKQIATELAWHFERGRDYKRSAKYLQQAADNAIRRFAYREAVALARRGLEIVQKLPDTAERAAQELGLHLTLGVPLIATEGYAAPIVGGVYQKARELCQQLGETPDVSEVLWGLWTFHTLRAEFEAGREIAEEFLRLSDRLPYPGLAMRGHWAMQITYMHQGHFTLSMEHFEKALSLYDPGRHLDDAFLYAQNPGVAMPCFAAWSLWFLGQPDQALQRVQEALALAAELSEPHGLAHARLFAAILHQFRREEKAAREYAEATIDVSREHGLVLYQATATVVRAWALIDQEPIEEVIGQIRSGLAALPTGTELVRPHFCALLAEALAKGGQTAEALNFLEDGLVLANRNGEGYYVAELHRLKGEVLLQGASRSFSRAAENGNRQAPRDEDTFAEAEACFHRSIETARRQKARSLELRAVTSLARLYNDRGAGREGSARLSEIYDTFTEGFDTSDLRDATALLAELS
jgi:predicted ATPase/DNA-binding winged helix-turn-helix (wHTH) protein